MLLNKNKKEIHERDYSLWVGPKNKGFIPQKLTHTKIVNFSLTKNDSQIHHEK